MLEVGAVEDSRCHQNDVRLYTPERRGRNILEDLAKVGCVVVHWLYAGIAVEIGEGTLESRTVLEHVAGTRGAAEIVLQNEIVPFAVSDQIGTADMDIDIFRNIESHELAAEMLCSKDVVRRNDPVLEDLLVVIDVVQEEI